VDEYFSSTGRNKVVPITPFKVETETTTTTTSKTKKLLNFPLKRAA
jgi:hypothetical protein